MREWDTSKGYYQFQCEESLHPTQTKKLDRKTDSKSRGFSKRQSLETQLRGKHPEPDLHTMVPVNLSKPPLTNDEDN